MEKLFEISQILMNAEVYPGDLGDLGYPGDPEDPEGFGTDDLRAYCCVDCSPAVSL